MIRIMGEPPQPKPPRKLSWPKRIGKAFDQFAALLWIVALIAVIVVVLASWVGTK